MMAQPHTSRRSPARAPKSLGRWNGWLENLGLRSKSISQSHPNTHTASNTTILGPIYRIPPEILADIFLLCLEDDPSPVPSRHHPCILLGMVCRVWRSIISSTPELWSTLEIAFSDHTRASCMAVMREWLPRSGSFPLTLRMLIALLHGGGVFGHQNKSLREALHFVGSTANRWQTVELEVPPEFADRLAAEGRLYLPLLESFTIRIMPDTVPIETYSTLDIFADAPRLRTLHIDWTASMTRRLDFPWMQLTTLRVTGVSVIDMCGILRKCPNLISYAYKDLEGGSGKRIGKIQLLKLKSLKVQLSHHFEPWDTFLLPAVESVVVDGRVYMYSDWCHPFVSFLPQIQTTLKILRLRHVVVTHLDLIAVLQSTPGIVEFEFIPQRSGSWSLNPYHSILFDHLHAAARHQAGPRLFPLLPNLKRLTLGGQDNDTPMDYKSSMAMLRSRWEVVASDDQADAGGHHPDRLPVLAPSQVTKLQYARLCFGRTWGGSWISREVASLRREGFDVKVLDPVE